MPVVIDIEMDTGLAIARCSGVLRLRDAQEGAAALWKTHGWQAKAAVWDFRAAELDFSSADAQRVAQFILENQPENPPAKVAFVTQRDFDFGMVRMFEVFREDTRTAIRVFRDYNQALAWARSLEPDAV